MEVVIPYFIWIKWFSWVVMLFLAYQSYKRKSKALTVITVLLGLFFFVANPKIDFVPTKGQTDRANAQTNERHTELPPKKVDNTFDASSNTNYQHLTDKDLEL